MSSDRERRKKLRGFVRKVINSGLDIRPEDAKKIVSIGKECLPVLSEFIRDETNWEKMSEDLNNISPLIAFCLIGAIGSPEGLDDIIYSVRKHMDDLGPVEDLISSVMASCADGKVETLLGIAFNPEINHIERMICLEALVDLSFLNPDTRNTIETGMVWYLNGPSTDPEMKGIVVSSLTDMKSVSFLPEIEKAFSRNQIDEKVISLDFVNREFKDENHRDHLKEMYQSPLSFFEPAYIQSLVSEEEDDMDYETQLAEEIAELRKNFDRIFQNTGRNDPCPCYSGKKFKDCCLPLIDERKRIDPVEEHLRNVIVEYTDDPGNKKSREEGIKQFDFGDIIVRENEMQLLMDWYVHDFVPPGQSNSVIEDVITKKRKDISEDEAGILKSWSGSVLNLYTVLSIRKGIGYTVEDLYLDPGKKIFIADVSSSLLLRKYELLFVRAYDFGIISRFAGGVVNGPYSLKNRFVTILNESYDGYLKRHGYSADPKDREVKKKFLKEESRNLIFAFIESKKKWNTKKFVTPEGHEVKYCNGVFQLKNERTAIKLISSDTAFLRSDDKSKIFFNWIDPGSRIGRIPVSTRGEGNQELMVENRVLIPESGDPKFRDGVIIYGNVEINAGTLILSTVSEERYAALKAVVHEVLGEQITKNLMEKFTGLGDKETDLEEPFEDEEDEYESDASEEDLEWPSDEKIHKVLDDEMIMMNYFRKWMDEKIPALEGKTPREASTDPNLKEKLRDLIREYEYNDMGKTFFVIPMIREELGIREDDL